MYICMGLSLAPEKRRAFICNNNLIEFMTSREEHRLRVLRRIFGPKRYGDARMEKIA
jgi:hypothetical protein